MVDVKKRKCDEESCLKTPNFNFDSETKGIQCAKHKKEGMIDLKNRRKCVEENCLKIPSFNFYSETNGIQCAKHKKEGMVDVKTKRKCV